MGLQGFDEFMNLVVDDAVEVKLKTKDTEESRRELGTCILCRLYQLHRNTVLIAFSLYRSDITQGRQCCADTELARLSGWLVVVVKEWDKFVRYHDS